MIKKKQSTKKKKRTKKKTNTYYIIHIYMYVFSKPIGYIVYMYQTHVTQCLPV